MYGAATPAGGMFAMLQSAGVVGLSAGAQTAVAVVGGAVGVAIKHHLDMID